jgi:hypothetical protein
MLKNMKITAKFNMEISGMTFTDDNTDPEKN